MYSTADLTKRINNMHSIHISTARRILRAPEPVDVKCWTKSGGIMELHNAIPLRYNFYEGDWGSLEK